VATRCDLSRTCRGKPARGAPPRIGAKISPQLERGMAIKDQRADFEAAHQIAHGIRRIGLRSTDG
jgi:hypothetical protein